MEDTYDRKEPTVTDAKPTPLEAIATLAKLGDPDKIAEFLQDQGITGQRAEAYRCPVACWVHRETGRNVAVGPYTFSLRDGNPMSRSVPGVLSDFIINFDQGVYPDLIESVTENER